MKRTLILSLVLASLGGVPGQSASGATQSSAAGPVLTRCGAALCLDGEPYRFTGVNAFELATDWSINWGCGRQVDDLDGFFASLRPNSVVRFWAYQDLAINKHTLGLDFGPIDRVVAAAERNRHFLILTLANQWSDCDGFAKDTAWYAAGYRLPRVGDDGVVRIAYADYVRQAVLRYRASPAVGMWEPVNEPEVACGAGFALRAFFDSVGGLIHALDRRHPVSSGVIGSGQCGAQGAEYQTLHASRGIDVASYHDYGRDEEAMSGDGWNGLAVRLAQAGALGKPLMVGEVGIRAHDAVAGCKALSTRRDQVRAKLSAQLSAGVAGILAWSWVPEDTGSCGFDIAPGDPLLDLLRDHPL